MNWPWLLAFLTYGCGGLLGGSSDQNGSHSAAVTGGALAISQSGGGPATGRLPAVGGSLAIGQSGGALAAGGQGAGGPIVTGGTPSTGGSTSTGGIPTSGGLYATGGLVALGGAATTGGAATGGSSNASGSSASGGVSASGGQYATGGAPGSMDCGANGIQCGGLPPTCPAGQTYLKVAACSGPCVLTEKCPPNWTSGTDALTVGVWLIGWMGDLSHYSVLRFNDDYSVEFRQAQIAFNEDFFPCLGIGQWGELQRQGAIHVRYPADCSETGTNGTSLIFDGFSSANGQWGAAMRATIKVGTSTTLDGYWFPTGTCSPAIANCPIGTG